MEELPQQHPKNLLTCALCKQLFNLTNREPIYLLCCGDVACKDCVKKVMIKSDDKEVVRKGQFECSFCHADHCAQLG
jgi:hypothetical protein